MAIMTNTTEDIRLTAERVKWFATFLIQNVDKVIDSLDDSDSMRYYATEKLDIASADARAIVKILEEAGYNYER